MAFTNRDNLFSFPDPVDEHAARWVATGVVVMAVAYLATGWIIIVAALAFGFIARVLTGPTLSPLGRLATQVIVPTVGLTPKHVPGPPKRFAQGIGATLSTAALISHLGGGTTLAALLVAAIVFAASLEAVFAYCLGCQIFTALMKVGIVPETICEACADITRRPTPAETG